MMNIRNIKEEIEEILEAMNEQIVMLRQHQDKIPQIEIDLFMSNIRDLYNAFLHLNKANAMVKYEGSGLKPPITEPKVTVNKEDHLVQAAAVQTTEKESAGLADEIPIRESIRFMPMSPVVEEVRTQTETELKEEHAAEITDPQNTPSEISLEKMDETTPPADEEIHEPAITGIPEKKPLDLFSGTPVTTVSDKLKEEKRTLNERIQAERQERTVGSRLQQHQIRDLKSAIGINEKFQFINELFKGSMQDYAIAINQLNQFEKFDDAIEYIDILKFKYNWDINSDAHHKLMDFVRRRYL